MTDNRAKHLQYIVVLTALTMAPQYALQGWLATGGEPSTLPDLVWWIDAGAWAIRALVEAWVLMYLFSTQPKTDNQAHWLTGFEVALIALITVTLGPALYAIGNRLPIAAALPVWAYWLWAFGVASYAPLMLGAAGFAWRVEQSQPVTDLTETPTNLTPTLYEPDTNEPYTCRYCYEPQKNQAALNVHEGRYCTARPVEPTKPTEAATNGKT